jgi:hypothetical protein
MSKTLNLNPRGSVTHLPTVESPVALTTVGSHPVCLCHHHTAQPQHCHCPCAPADAYCSRTATRCLSRTCTASRLVPGVTRCVTSHSLGSLLSLAAPTKVPLSHSSAALSAPPSSRKYLQARGWFKITWAASTVRSQYLAGHQHKTSGSSKVEHVSNCQPSTASPCMTPSIIPKSPACATPKCSLQQHTMPHAGSSCMTT